MSGYYLMHRGWMNHPVFRAAPLTEREAWLWLIEEASYSDRRFRMGAQIINLQRGQLATSYRFLAKAWGWDKGRIQRFLRRLETEAMIGTTNDTHCTLITVCNYGIYQTTAHDDETVDDALNDTAVRQQRDSSETKQKEGKEGKEDISVSADDDLLMIPGFLLRKSKPDCEVQFDEWWTQVPKKVAKDRALKAFKAALKKTDYPTLLAGIRAYSQQVRSKEDQYIAHPATWLNDGRWLDEPERKTHGNQHRGNGAGKGRPSAHDTLLAAGAFAASSRPDAHQGTAPEPDGAGNGDAGGPASGVPRVP